MVLFTLASVIFIGCWGKKATPVIDPSKLTLAVPDPDITDRTGTESPITPKYRYTVGELKRRVEAATTKSELLHLLAISQIRSMSLHSFTKARLAKFNETSRTH